MTHRCSGMGSNVLLWKITKIKLSLMGYLHPHKNFKFILLLKNYQVRKSRDYIYGMWHYKVLCTKKQCHRISFERKNTRIDIWRIQCEIALRWMSQDITDDKSTLVQLMACCHQVTSHYLNWCWPRSVSPYGITRSYWVKLLQYFVLHYRAMEGHIFRCN